MCFGRVAHFEPHTIDVISWLYFYTIARHLELRERSNGKAITELKEKIFRLKEAHSEEIRSLEIKIKKDEDKCSAKEKE